MARAMYFLLLKTSGRTCGRADHQTWLSWISGGRSHLGLDLLGAKVEDGRETDDHAAEHAVRVATSAEPGDFLHIRRLKAVTS